MSIISEALKKANSERHRSAASDRKSAGASAVRPWASSVIILTLLVLPFVLPRLISRTGAVSTPSQASLPMANLPSNSADSSAGLAQTAIESGSLPATGTIVAGLPAQSLPLTASSSAIPGRPDNAVTSINGRRLQGIVWTANKGYYAILDSEVIRVGSLVDNLRVTQITPAGVELTDGTDTVFIEKVF